MAIDHGTARAGLAISDPTGAIASPVGTVEPPEPREVAARAAEHGAELIVVGLPIGLGGREGEQARLVRRFAGALAAMTSIPVETYDERLTTRMAEQSARQGARAEADALAAAHLLEAYLASRSRAR